MVLGFLLYEAADVVYNVGRVGWNSVAGVYRWYYGEEEEESQGRRLTEAEIDEIVDRLAKLEVLVASTLPQGDQADPPPCQPPSSSGDLCPTGANVPGPAVAATSS